MIIGVTEQYHDYQPQLYFLDTDKLDESNPVDAAVIKAVKSKKQTAFVDASQLEEPSISVGAKLKSGPAERLVYLVVQFE